MLRVLVIGAIGAIAAAVLVALMQDGDVAGDAAAYYGANLRGSLFSGFLGLGGFLLSLKTFIVVKMKEELYDHDLYRKRVSDARAAHPARTIKVFEPLGRLRFLLFFSIVSSLTTAVLQMTLGLLKVDAVVAVCLGAAAFTIALLVQSLWEINGNLRTWFELLEQAADEQPPAAAP